MNVIGMTGALAKDSNRISTYIAIKSAFVATSAMPV